MNVTKQYIDWENLTLLVENLAHKIENSNLLIHDIFGLPRGGLIPAVMLSHRLDIPISKGTISPNTLIVDDICDSGETFKNIFNRYQTEYSFPFYLKTACLHHKPHTSIFTPSFYASEWVSNDWIIYPWEKVDSNPIQDYKSKLGIR
jgi:hypoxanthine phosphoribosyltransferase